MKTISIALAIAFIFWSIIFSPFSPVRFNFWVELCAASAILAAIGVVSQKGSSKELYYFRPLHIIVGIISAAVLYLIFLAGNYMLIHVSASSQAQIADVYKTRTQAPAGVIAFFLLVWIGPAEEIFWRGFIQQRLSRFFGSVSGYLMAAFLYAIVHVFSWNLPLFLAALTAGLFWGWLFRKYKSIWPCVISHSLWDAAIFVFFPIG